MSQSKTLKQRTVGVPLDTNRLALDHWSGALHRLEAALELLNL